MSGPAPQVPVQSAPPAQPAVLPKPAPLPMPVQSLREGTIARDLPPTSPPRIAWRRAYILGGTATLTLVAAHQIGTVLARNGLGFLEAFLLALFVPLFAWIALSFVSAVAGFALIVARRADPLGVAAATPLPAVSTRTALLVPTYNEDPRRLLAGLQAMHESLADTGQLDRFDFFILSDSTRADILEQERRAYADLLARTGTRNVFYRRRSDNVERKAGNIAEWVQRFGAGYPHLLILDADSLMTGDAIVRLAAAMERHPRVALIQTLPVIVNGATLFARMQQFAGRVYGPVIAHGVAWWHGAESNYWGHNAIIRTRAFAENAGLPALRGPRPFGGHLLSHDFVEAALLRRGGWALHMVPALKGSYEEGPPSLTDMLVRDRRWCQGNLQHAAVLPARGLHWVNRWHLLIGIGHYFTAPMWAMLMLVGIAIPLERSGFAAGILAMAEFSPVAYWRSLDPARVLWVFVATMGALFAPKVMGTLAVLANRDERRGCGGGVRTVLGMLVESVLAALMAPIVMYVQSRGVAEVLAGRDSGWESQRRDDGSLPLSALVRRYGGMGIVGVLAGVAAFAVSPALAAWLSPVILGLVLAIPTVALTSSRAAGQWLCGWRLLCIPEESEAPAIVRRAQELRQGVVAGGAGIAH